MKIDDVVATTTPATIGTAKFSTAFPPQIAIGRIESRIATDV